MTDAPTALDLPQADPLPEDIEKYFKVCQDKLGMVPNVLRAYAFAPEKLRAFSELYNDLMLAESGLSKLEREMIAVAVSAVNRCYYCLTAHGAAVRQISGDPELGELMVMNYRVADLSPKQRAMLDFAVIDDRDGLEASMRMFANAAPVAEAGPPVETDRLYVELSAAGSGDADGDALIYRWDFGDGTPPVFGERVTHVYPRSGIYPVTLRVDDGTGLSNARAVDATTVSVNARPIADAGGNRDVCSGEPILFDASDSLDPDGGLLAYAWDFGDGRSSTERHPTHRYDEPGEFIVTLHVEGPEGKARRAKIWDVTLP